MPCLIYPCRRRSPPNQAVLGCDVMGLQRGFPWSATDTPVDRLPPFFPAIICLAHARVSKRPVEMESRASFSIPRSRTLDGWTVWMPRVADQISTCRAPTDAFTGGVDLRFVCDVHRSPSPCCRSFDLAAAASSACLFRSATRRAPWRANSRANSFPIRLALRDERGPCLRVVTCLFLSGWKSRAAWMCRVVVVVTAFPRIGGHSAHSGGAYRAPCRARGAQVLPPERARTRNL